MVWVSEERSGELVPRSLQEFGAVPRGGGWSHINEGGRGGGGSHHLNGMEGAGAQACSPLHGREGSSGRGLLIVSQQQKDVFVSIVCVVIDRSPIPPGNARQGT